MVKFKPNRKEIEKDVVTRIRVIEGHLKKVKSMIEEKDTKCQDILAQTHAIECALKKVNEIIIINHFQKCVWDEKSEKKCSKHDFVIEEIITILNRKK